MSDIYRVYFGDILRDLLIFFPPKAHGNWLNNRKSLTAKCNLAKDFGKIYRQKFISYHFGLNEIFSSMIF